MASSEFGGLQFTETVNSTIVTFDIDNKDLLTLTLGGDNIQGIIGVRVGDTFITIDELDYKSKDDDAGTVTYELNNSGLRLLFNEFKQVAVEVITDTFVMTGQTSDGNTYELEDDKLILNEPVDKKSKVSVVSGEYASIESMPNALSNAVVAMAGVLYQDNTTKQIPATITAQVQEYRDI